MVDLRFEPGNLTVTLYGVGRFAGFGSEGNLIELGSGHMGVCYTIRCIFQVFETFQSKQNCARCLGVSVWVCMQSRYEVDS